MNEKTYTTFQVAEICSVRPTTVIKWAKQEKIKAYTTPGGHRRILESDLKNFLKKYNFPAMEEFSAGDKKRILIVEDDKDIGLMLKKAFRHVSEDVDVVHMADSVEALLSLGKQPPDLMILDVVMPVMDGGRVLSTLKADPQTQDIKVIGITGKRLASEKLKYMQNHTDAFFLKPFNVGELVQKSLELIKVSAPVKVGTV